MSFLPFFAVSLIFFCYRHAPLSGRGGWGHAFIWGVNSYFARRGEERGKKKGVVVVVEKNTQTKETKNKANKAKETGNGGWEGVHTHTHTRATAQPNAVAVERGGLLFLCWLVGFSALFHSCGLPHPRATHPAATASSSAAAHARSRSAAFRDSGDRRNSETQRRQATHAARSSGESCVFFWSACVCGMEVRGDGMKKKSVISSHPKREKNDSPLAGRPRGPRPHTPRQTGSR